jgi:hypothetical protein
MMISTVTADTRATHIAAIHLGIQLPDLVQLLHALGGMSLGPRLLLPGQIDPVIHAFKRRREFLLFPRQLLYHAILTKVGCAQVLVKA